jgi:hypothetical protein
MFDVCFIFFILIPGTIFITSSVIWVVYKMFQSILK